MKIRYKLAMLAVFRHVPANVIVVCIWIRHDIDQLLIVDSAIVDGDLSETLRFGQILCSGVDGFT